MTLSLSSLQKGHLTSQLYLLYLLVFAVAVRLFLPPVNSIPHLAPFGYSKANI
jgi:hypothetical protein